jgi:hypothetical protein
MTTEEKRKALADGCKSNGMWCDDCPLYQEESCEFEHMPDHEIDRIYDIKFPTTEPTHTQAKGGMDYEKAWKDAARLNDELQFEIGRLKETIVAMCKSFYEPKGGKG